MLDLPGPPEKYRQMALAQITLTSDALAAISRDQWYLPTVLPFWRVCDVVSHLYVVAGFFTSATPIISGPTLRSRPAWLTSRALDATTPVLITSLHYSNILMPRIASHLLTQSTSVGAVRTVLEMLADKVAKSPESRLAQDFPYFRWAVPVHLYVAVLAKELAVHRWEIENAINPSAVDQEVGVLLPMILWAAAPVYSRAPRQLKGTVRTVEPARVLTWQVESGKITPVRFNHERPVDAVISGESADLALTMMGRTPPTRLGLSGDRNLGLSFLHCFSYQAGPTPFFNP